METGSLKLILIIVISIAIVVLLGMWIKGTLFKEKGVSLEEVEMMVPTAAKDSLIKARSLISRSREEIIQFLDGLYDENQNGFKMKKDSEVTLEATYYGLEVIHNLRITLPKAINSQAVLDRVHSYYVTPGYYLEKDKDPVFSTMWALSIDVRFPEDLERAIDSDWLKNNSLENKNLEANKLNPEYQAAVVEIHRLLEKPEKLEEISYAYFNHYCRFHPPEDTSDKDYLKEKYFQIFLISGLSGATSATNITENCLGEEAVKADEERLSQIQLEQLDDIEEVYWFYYLQKFYNLKPDLEEIFKKVENFYSEGGLKEKLTDPAPNLIGTYYGILFVK